MHKGHGRMFPRMGKRQGTYPLLAAPPQDLSRATLTSRIGAAWLLNSSSLLSSPNTSLMALLLIYYMSASDDNKREQWRGWRLEVAVCLLEWPHEDSHSRGSETPRTKLIVSLSPAPSHL